MKNLFKYASEHWKALLAIVAILIVQAYCDLSLPAYTSDIVNVGIQQGGVEDHIPDAISVWQATAGYGNKRARLPPAEASLFLLCAAVSGHLFGRSGAYCLPRYLPHSRSSACQTGYSAPCASKKRLKSRLNASISSTAFIAWSDAQSFPRLVAHMSLKKRRQVLRYAAPSNSASAFGRISCPASRMAR